MSTAGAADDGTRFLGVGNDVPEYRMSIEAPFDERANLDTEALGDGGQVLLQDVADTLSIHRGATMVSVSPMFLWPAPVEPVRR